MPSLSVILPSDVAAPSGETELALALAAALECDSTHPIARSILAHAAQEGIEPASAQNVREIAGKGMTEFVYTSGNAEGIDRTLDYMDRDSDGLIFTNLVDYDMLYGHRRDVDGYAKALTYFDERLPEIVSKMREEDILILTADHGCDPGYTRSTDHTREYIPLILYGKSIEPRNIGTRSTYADIGFTVGKYLGLEPDIEGESIL